MIRTLPALLLIALVGCDGARDEAADGDADTDVAGDPVPEVEIDPACEYTAGPYGTIEGDVIDNLSWDLVVGGGAVSLRQFHCDPSTKLLLMYGTAGWCSFCAQESEALPALYTEFHPQGFEVIVLVYEDSEGHPADLSFAGAYESRYGFPFSTIADHENLIGDYHDPSEAPINVFVNLNTMEILSIFPGYDAGPFRSQIETLLASI